ncbi:MAG: hypothetical protein ACM3ML_04915 [Micromonosporaceae bacterium]
MESRGRSLGEGVSALRAELTRSGGTTRPLQATCDAITQELRQQGEDDITLVLARLAREARC